MTLHNKTTSKVNSQTLSTNNIFLDNDSKTKVTEKLLNKYHNVFEGVGKYKKDQVHLFINNKVPPVAQKAKRIPYKMREKVSNELEMLRQQDIIEDVKDEPTPWISPIAVAPENYDKTKISLCIDMREANKAIERTRYLSPSLEDLINILQGSKIYCKLDMNNAFLQFELDSAFREITTFTTHEGLHRFKRLNLGTNVASEVLQSKMDEILRNIPVIPEM